MDGTTPLARAAYAAVQLAEDGTVLRCVVGAVPPSFPQTADVAEHMAVLAVANSTSPDDPVVVVSDCASVVQAFAIGAVLADRAHRPHAGLWRRIARDNITDIIKVKAHLTREEAEARGELLHWRGNDMADHYAKDTAWKSGCSEGQRKAFDAAVKVETVSFRTAATLLAEWPVPSPDLATLARARSGRNRRYRPAWLRHQFVWVHHLRRWRCTECGASKRSRASAVDLKPCLGQSLMQLQLHSSHRLLAAHLVEDEGLVLFCTRCCQYAESRACGLAEPCGGCGPRGQGPSKGGLYRRQRFLAGLHPKKSGVRLEQAFRYFPEPFCAVPAVVRTALAAAGGEAAADGGEVPIPGAAAAGGEEFPCAAARTSLDDPEEDPMATMDGTLGDSACAFELPPELDDLGGDRFEAVLPDEFLDPDDFS